jgi:glycosyltransferase involved in cell wall biosynthesis
MPLPPDEVVVAALGAHELTAPGFRARVLLLRPELARYRVRVDPYTLFTTAQSASFARTSLAGRTRILLAARSRLLRRINAMPPATGVTLIQRQADLLPSLRLEKRASEGRRLVWDVDDAIWLDAEREAQGHVLAGMKRTARKVRWLVSSADEVVVANDVLAEYFGRLTDRLTVVPSVVEPRGQPVREHEDREDLILGWIGSRTTASYLGRLQSVLPRVSAALEGRRVRLLVVGGSSAPIDHVRVENRNWSLHGEIRALSEIDIGLMPVPDNAWTRGKSAYKALVYMVAGIPVVADDVGIASSTIGNDRGGFVVRSDREWVEAIVALARSRSLRERLGRQGRERVEEHFSVQAWAPEMAAILRGEK